MFINDLPDDCLLTIFDYFDSLEDLVNLSKAFPDWLNLISHRLSKVKYLSMVDRKCNDALYSSKAIYLRDATILTDLKLNQLLPNLKILDTSYDTKEFVDVELKEMISGNPTIKGLIEPPFLVRPSIAKSFYFGNIQMLMTNMLDMGKWVIKMYSSDNLNQLYIDQGYISRLKKYNDHFPKLNRFHVCNYECVAYADQYYDGSFLLNLKILEFSSQSKDGRLTYPGYHFMDYCPSLESAFLHSETDKLYVNESIMNYHLKDLVIEHADKYNQSWSSLGSLLTKFPNLKHLAIRRNDKINDCNVKELITLLPEIELMDFRGSPHVTHRSADYVKSYCEKSGRSIAIYYNWVGVGEPSDWPKLGGSKYKVCFGLDFMRHCFFKHWDQLPYLLDS